MKKLILITLFMIPLNLFAMEQNADLDSLIQAADEELSSAATETSSNTKKRKVYSEKQKPSNTNKKQCVEPEKSTLKQYHEKDDGFNYLLTNFNQFGRTTQIREHCKRPEKSASEQYHEKDDSFNYLLTNFNQFGKITQIREHCKSLSTSQIFNLANHYLMRGQLNYANECYKLIAKRDVAEGDNDKQDKAKALFNLGLIYKMQGKNEQAEKYFKDTAEQNDHKQSKVKALLNLGILCKTSGRLEQAEKYYKDAAKQDDNKQLKAKALYNLGLLYKTQGKNPEATRCFVGVIALIGIDENLKTEAINQINKLNN